MKAYIYPADLHGCGYLRLIWPAQALRNAGYDVTIIYPSGSNTRNALGLPEPTNSLQGQVDGDGNTVRATAPKDADVMVLQRITHKHVAQAIPLWRHAGIAVVIDIDDDLTTIHPSNPAWAALHPTQGKENFGWQYLTQACEAATLVTTSTPALIDRYAPHGRGIVIPNCIPASYLDIAHPDLDILGWGGSVASHPNDLQMVGTTIARLIDDGHEFTIVGPGQGVEQALHLTAKPWHHTGAVKIHDWPHALASNIGVGIAPLADTVFNASKSCLKVLEYASLGIPVVMSPRADYVRLHKEGVGILADKQKDWLRHLRKLVTHKHLREELSGRGRETAKRFTIEGNAHRWWDAWTWAYQHQRNQSSTVLSNSPRTINISRDGTLEQLS